MRATPVLFNLILAPLIPALGLYTLHRRFVQKKSVASFKGQWGFVPAEARQKDGNPKIWLHAVSVGETIAARPIARALKSQMPNCQIVLSCTTDTGFGAAQALKKCGEVDATIYFPLDIPFVIRRVLSAVSPDAILFVETELWPNLLEAAKRRGIKTFLVNGRVSDNLLQLAPRLKPIWRWMASNLDGFLMRSAEDAERAKKIGAPAEKVVVAGDVKLEAPPVENGREKWREILGFSPNQLVWIAGSTHAGEEAICFRVHQKLREKWPDLGLIVAPRHIERAEEVAAILPDAARRSHLQKAKNGVILLDTIGELSEIYAAADVAFVGGSLIERGGHNLLEPVLRGAPVVFGPFVMNFRAAAQLVQANELGEQIEDENGLFEAISRWLENEKSRRALPQKTEKALAQHRGAAARVAKFIAQSLEIQTGFTG